MRGIISICNIYCTFSFQQNTENDNNNVIIFKFEGQEYTSVIFAIKPTPYETPEVSDVIISACYTPGKYWLPVDSFTTKSIKTIAQWYYIA